MPQLSLYLDDASMDSLRKQAEQKEVSLSFFVREVLENAHSSDWPKGYWDLYGSLNDATFTVPEELDFVDDISRPSWD